MQDSQKGLIAVHLAPLLLAGTGLFAKLVNLPATDISILRSLIAAVVLALLVGLRGNSFKLNKPEHYPMIVLLGVLLGVHWVTYFYAMQTATIAIGMLALYTYPVITVLLEPLFNREPFHWQDLLAAVIMLIGVAIMVPEFSLSNSVFISILVGMFSAVLFSIRNILQRKHFSDSSAQLTFFYQALVCGLILLPFIGDNALDNSNQQWLLLIILGVIFTTAPHVLLATALRYLKAKTVSLITCIQPVYGAILALLLLSEQPAPETLIGGGLIVLCAVYESVGFSKQGLSRKS